MFSKSRSSASTRCKIASWEEAPCKELEKPILLSPGYFGGRHGIVQFFDTFAHDLDFFSSNDVQMKIFTVFFTDDHSFT